MNESVSNPTSFLGSLEQVFFFEMDQQTSACLFGSSLTDDWISGRSDLDLFVVVPEEKIELFGEKIRMWQSKPEHPTLDGYVLYSSGNVAMVREFYKFENAFRLTEKFIPLIDSWNIRNRSRHLFGKDMNTFVREISQEELKDWAFKYIEGHWIPLLNDLILRGSPEAKIPLSALIFIASGVARMLMLTKGNICSSKREALQWLADEYIETREIINLLKEDFQKADTVANTFTASQSRILGNNLLKILCEIKL